MPVILRSDSDEESLRLQDQKILRYAQDDNLYSILFGEIIFIFFGEKDDKKRRKRFDR